MKDAKFRVYYLVRFNNRTGKPDTTMGGVGVGLLKLWALQETKKKTQDTVIFDEYGNVVAYYEGTGDFPNIIKPEEGEHIDQYCVGLLEACNAQFEDLRKKYEDA